MTVEKIDFDAQLEYLRLMYEKNIPFNKLLGFQVETLKPGFVAVKFDMRDDFIGNYVHGILHGGVISAVMDATGGMAATVSILEKMQGKTVEEIANRLAKIGTIDLRVDYLRPGRGEHFRSTGSIMRAGNKVAVTRMELHNHKGLLIAVGTGTYIVG